jgi:hypothetical protein
MSKLADDMVAYIRTGDLRGLALVTTRDALMSRLLDNDPTLSEDERQTLRALDDLLSSEPRERIERARRHQKSP